jgi:chemotaxis protein histidine kinase CheA
MDEASEYCEEELGENIIRELRKTFKDEAYELLAELESSLLALEKDPCDQELINRVFRTMHTIKGSGATCELTEIVAFTHELETFFELVRKGKISITKEIIDLTLTARDQIKALFDAHYFTGTADAKKTQEIVSSFQQRCFHDEDPADDREWVVSDEKRYGDLFVDSGQDTSVKPDSALTEQQIAREPRTGRLKAEESANIRVATEKLDRLVNLVGELVTVQARLSQTALLYQIPPFLSIAEEVERLSGNLRDITMNMRMLPIGTTFNRFNRLVRDLSAELGKEAELTTNGADTELDKTLIERLSDPLVHLIKNSIDHGIEPPDVRKAAGKPAQGTVCLSATHSGASVLIEIRDDGAGLDREAIRARAIDRGLIQEETDLSDQEIFSLVFVPGFSMTDTVTSVSGRGVGLDVVKETIDALRGSLEINSQRGIGTTISLTLPLTLAIIDGLLVKIHEQYYVLPLSFVKECVELTAEDKKNANNRNIANIRGEIVPYINLREQFQIDGEPPAIEQIVIAEIDGYGVGFVVDSVIGGHQTVIKNLGTCYRAVEGISGATILGNGMVALILDVPKLLKIIEQEERDGFFNGSHHAFMQRGGAASLSAALRARQANSIKKKEVERHV